MNYDEAKAILNEELLRELKESKIDKFNFKWMVEESESALKISREFLNWDKREKRKKLIIRIHGDRPFG